MKLRIRESEYDYRRALDKGELGVLYDLRLAGGPGRRSIALALDLFDTGLKQEEGETEEQKAERAAAMEDDPRVLLGLSGLVFICKRYAGERITWAEAQTYGWEDIQFIIEQADIEAALARDATDPPEASGGQNPAGAETRSEPKPRPKRAAGNTRKTSKPPSTSTS